VIEVADGVRKAHLFVVPLCEPFVPHFELNPLPWVVGEVAYLMLRLEYSAAHDVVVEGATVSISGEKGGGAHAADVVVVSEHAPATALAQGESWNAVFAVKARSVGKWRGAVVSVTWRRAESESEAVTSVFNVPEYIVRSVPLRAVLHAPRRCKVGEPFPVELDIVNDRSVPVEVTLKVSGGPSFVFGGDRKATLHVLGSETRSVRWAVVGVREDVAGALMDIEVVEGMVGGAGASARAWRIPVVRSGGGECRVEVRR